MVTRDADNSAPAPSSEHGREEPRAAFASGVSAIDDAPAEACLAGGGELGARMRAIDWSRTPLGPVASWPQSLKTCVRIVLTSRQPMFVWWGDDLINLYNDAYTSILGGKHPDALGQPAAIVWREIWDQVGPRAASAMRANEGTYDEALLLLMERNGYPEETYYTFSYSPVPNDQGGTGGILCANTDDTQRILGERQLALLRELAAQTVDARTAEDACAWSASCLATNPRDLPFALIYLVDPARRRAVLAGAAGIAPGHPAAPECVALDGPSPWPFAEVLRSHEPRLVMDLDATFGDLPADPWRRPPARAALVPIASSGTGRAGLLVVGLNPFRLLDEGYDSFLGLVAAQIAASITHAQAYEDERKRAEALAAVDRAKTLFFSNISHEFRTPLTLILGPIEDALASAAGALAGEELGAVHRNAMRLLKLVNALLDFSRIEAGRADARYEPTDLATLTADLASTFRSAIERAGLVFDVDCAPLPEPIFVDHDLWEKIVLNLLSNALKFTFEGTIRVALRPRGEHVELEVSDTGAGIADEELPRIFERFHRVQDARARTHEGSGIGLALVHELVRLHGGSLAVESALGRGTTFTAAIPRGSAHLPQDHVQPRSKTAPVARSAAPYVEEALRWLPDSEPPPRPAPAPFVEPGHSVLAPHTGARILLADDNADMRAYVQRILGEHWTVEAVGDGGAALEAALRSPPDLVLTDVMMPGLDGFGLLRELRAHEATRRLPVILLSARAGDESRVEGLTAGADDYLVKPFSARELTARVATHLHIADLRRVAERERAKLYALFQQAPVAIGVVRGPEHRYTLANPLYAQMFGRRDFVGRTVREVFPEIEDQGIHELLDRAYASGERIAFPEFRAMFDRRGDGTLEEAFFAFNLEPVREPDGRSTAILSIAVDVTEQVRARRRLEEAAREREALLRRAEEAQREAEAANRTKDEFLAMLGHELRNPLAPIVTALYLMRLRAGGVAERERVIIERQVQHLTSLVDDLLDVSRITRGKIELKKQRLELAEVVAKAIEVASPLLELRQHHLMLDVPSRGLAVDVDPTRLAQVISNLLSNAAKYTEVGGRVAVDARRDGDVAVLRVRDNGMGIDPEVLPKIFDLFVQERQALDRSRGGLGLGLAIVRSLVTLHDGSVSASSEGRGRGSTFTIRLPAADPLPSDEPAASAPRPSGAGPAPRAAGHRILVVDDNQDAAELLADAITAFGHVARVAHDGPSALELAATFRPDIALLDIGLPVMDGYELAERLRRLPGLERIYLIAVTGYGQGDDRSRSQSAGFEAHLVKPVELDALQARLEELQDRRPPRP